MGAGAPGPRAREMLDLGDPDLRLRGPGRGDGRARQPGHHRRRVHRPAGTGLRDARADVGRGRPRLRPPGPECPRSTSTPTSARRPPRTVGAHRVLGVDEALLDVVTSASVACGFHAGDAGTMRRTVEEAARRGVVVGAHPSYLDRAGFGRRPLDIAPAQVAAEVVYQVEALDAVARAAGTRVRYVKPHGALYHRMAVDEACARAVIDALRAWATWWCSSRRGRSPSRWPAPSASRSPPRRSPTAPTWPTAGWPTAAPRVRCSPTPTRWPGGRSHWRGTTG